MLLIVQNRIISFSMITIRLEIPVLLIIIPPRPRRFGGGSVPLITIAAIFSAMSIRTEVATAITLTTLLVCGPALPSNPPQDDPGLGLQVKDDRCKRKGTSLGSQSLKLPRLGKRDGV